MLCEWVLTWVHIGKWGEGDNWGKKKSAENGRGAGPRRKDFSVCLFHDYPLIPPPSPSHTQIHTHLTRGVTQTEASHPVTLPSSANFFTEHLHLLDLDLTESSWIFFNATLAIMTLLFCYLFILLLFLSHVYFISTLKHHFLCIGCARPSNSLLKKVLCAYSSFPSSPTSIRWLFITSWQRRAQMWTWSSSVVRLAASQGCIALNCVRTAVTNALD